jgi:hypothetical protein
MFLPLADRMTKKYVDEGKINAEAGMYMYIWFYTGLDISCSLGQVKVWFTLVNVLCFLSMGQVNKINKNSKIYKML